MLKTRILTGCVLASMMLAAVFYLSCIHFLFFIGCLVGLAAWEWANLSGCTKNWQRIFYVGVVSVICFVIFYRPVFIQSILIISVFWWVIALFLVSFYPASNVYFRYGFLRLMMGLFTLIPAWSALIVIRSDYGIHAVLLVFLLVGAADAGAYFTGRKIGKRKLSPRVSPKKTIEGFIGGGCLSIIVALIISFIFHMSLYESYAMIVLSILTTFASVLGDLFESLLKRERGVKDSGRLLPGHGGILDRIDSLTAALPIFAFAITVSGG